MNKLLKLLTLFVLALSVASCDRVKTTPVVTASYADGKPRILTEYIVDEYGRKKIYRETYFFPGEKKYIEGKYDTEALRNGVWTSWYENGNKNSQQKYVNGKEDGKYRVWHSNGKLFIKGKYKMGQKTGVWKFYDSLGVKTKEMNFNSK